MSPRSHEENASRNNVARVCSENYTDRIAYVDRVHGGHEVTVFFEDVVVWRSRYKISHAYVEGTLEAARHEARSLVEGELPERLQQGGWTFDDLRLDNIESEFNWKARNAGYPRDRSAQHQQQRKEKQAAMAATPKKPGEKKPRKMTPAPERVAGSIRRLDLDQMAECADKVVAQGKRQAAFFRDEITRALGEVED